MDYRTNEYYKDDHLGNKFASKEESIKYVLKKIEEGDFDYIDKYFDRGGADWICYMDWFSAKGKAVYYCTLTSALLYSMKSNDFSMADLFVAKDEMFKEDYMVHWAMKRCGFNQVKYLIDAGYNIDKCSISPKPLAYAIKIGNEKYVELLLRNGAKIDKMDEYKTFLTFAIRRKVYYSGKKIYKNKFCLRCVKLLLEYGSNVKIKTKPIQSTALTWCARMLSVVNRNGLEDVPHDYLKCIKLLIEYGADFNHKNSRGLTFRNYIEYRKRSPIDANHITDVIDTAIKKRKSMNNKIWKGGLIECCAQYIKLRKRRYDGQLKLLNRDLQKLIKN